MTICVPAVASRCLVRVRILRWVPVILVAILNVWIYYAFVYGLCFVLVKNVPQRVAYLSLFHVLLFLYLWSYLKALFTPAGKATARFHPPVAVLDEIRGAANDQEVGLIAERFAQDSGLPSIELAMSGSVRWCAECECVKPDRAHHCRVCNQCILKFDHHCFWVNNCVNHRNHKYFILFLGRNRFSHGYSQLLYILSFVAILVHLILFMVDKGWLWDCGSASEWILLGLLAVLAPIIVPVCLILIDQLRSIAKNRTEIEHLRGEWYYNLGCLKNFTQVFGSNCLLWLFPLWTSRGDGIRWPHI